MVLVTKHSWWRGSYERGLLLSPTGVRTVDPADGRVTNEWPWSSLRGVAETEKAGRSAFVLTFEQEPGKCFFWPAAKKAALTFSSSDASARAGLLGVLRKAIQQESLLATVRHTLTMHRRLSDQAAAVAAAAEEEHGSCAHGRITCTHGYSGAACEMPPAVRMVGATEYSTPPGPDGELVAPPLDLNIYELDGLYIREKTRQCNGRPVYKLGGTPGGATLYMPTDSELWRVSLNEGARSCEVRNLD